MHTYNCSSSRRSIYTICEQINSNALGGRRCGNNKFRMLSKSIYNKGIALMGLPEQKNVFFSLWKMNLVVYAKWRQDVKSQRREVIEEEMINNWKETIKQPFVKACRSEDTKIWMDEVIKKWRSRGEAKD